LAGLTPILPRFGVGGKPDGHPDSVGVAVPVLLNGVLGAIRV
jgi:hypothetical protein